MKVLLKILATLLIVFVLLIAVVVLLPDQQYKALTTKVVKYTTDRDVAIGELTTVRSLNPSIELKSVAFANPDWAKGPHMITAKKLFLSIDLRELIKGKLHVHDLSADALNVDLLKNQQGDTNWHFQKLKPKSDKKFDFQNLARLILSKLDLNDAQVEYLDQQKKSKYRLELPALQLAETEQGNAQRVTAHGEFNDLPFSINGEAGLIDSLATQNTLPFDLEAVLNESKTRFSGEVERSNDSFQLTTSIVANTNSLADLSAFTTRELPAIGPINITADISGDLQAINQKGIDVKNLDINIDDPSIDLKVGGELSGLAATNQGEVNIDLDVNDLTKLLKLAGLNKGFPGTLTLQAAASGSGKNFGLEISKAVLDSEFIQAELSGDVKDLLNGADAQVDIKANAANLDVVTHFFNRKMPPEWGPVNATAKLVGKNKQYSIQDIVLNLEGKSKLKAVGSIEELIGFDNMQLDVQAGLATLAEISAFTPSPLPDMGPINATGKISWQDGKLSLSDAKANYAGQYGNADVTGSIGDLIKFDVVRLKADANVPDLSVAEAFSGHKMPEVGQIKATADLISPTARDLSAKNLVVTYENNGIKLNAVGSVDSMIKNRAQLNLDVQADVNSLTSINPMVKANLPDIGPLSVKARLTGATKNIEIMAIQGEIKDKSLKGTVKGNLGRVVDLKGIDLEADLMTPSMRQLLTRFNIKTDVKKPASLSSHFEYQDGALHLDSAELDIAGNKVIGDLSLQNYLDKSQRPKLVGEINILNFDMLDVTGKKLGEEKQQTTNKLLSDNPLPYEFIRKNDLDLKIKIGRLRANIFDFENAAVNAKSNNGVFQFGPFEGTLGGGHALFQFDVNTQRSPAFTSVNARIDGFDIARAGVFRDSEQIESSGDAFANLVLNGSGESIAAIMSNANGGGSLYFEDLLLKKGTLKLFSSDLIVETLSAVNPFKKKQKDTQINCSAVAFNIKDGVLTTPYGLAAEAVDFSMTGNSRINFGSEAIDLQFSTKPKKGLGLGFSKLTGIVQVVGTLTEPQVTLDPKGIFELGATVGAALATGGLSLLAQGQLEKMQAKSELCAKALGPAG